MDVNEHTLPNSLDYLTRKTKINAKISETKRSELGLNERKKGWELLPLEELRVAAKILLRAPYPEQKDELIVALARTHDACPPGMLSSSTQSADHSLGFKSPASVPPISPFVTSTSNHTDFSLARQHGFHLGKANLLLVLDLVLDLVLSLIVNIVVPVLLILNICICRYFPLLQLYLVRHLLPLLHLHQLIINEVALDPADPEVVHPRSPGRSDLYINFRLSSKVIKRIREGMLVRIHELYGDSSFTGSETKKRTLTPKSFQEWYRLFRKLLKVREFYAPDTRESNSLYVDHI